MHAITVFSLYYLGLDNVVGVLKQKNALLLWRKGNPDSVDIQEPLIHLFPCCLRICSCGQLCR